ncbi:MAG: single-stranded DNA-binding protein [Crocinitomicaceae bacterium]|nr:single-stranded DNA-binding protein [Crocinitomicaceae bacterium]
MAGSVNKVILIGNLGADPEIRSLENGAKLGRFSIATSETYTDKVTGERRENTDWHNIVVWRNLADIAERFLKKGTKVYVEGKLKSRSWVDEAGTTKYVTEVVADNFTMLSTRSEMDNPTKANHSPYPTNEQNQEPKKLPEDLLNDDDDDVLPF